MGFTSLPKRSMAQESLRTLTWGFLSSAGVSFAPYMPLNDWVSPHASWYNSRVSALVNFPKGLWSSLEFDDSSAGDPISPLPHLYSQAAIAGSCHAAALFLCQWWWWRRLAGSAHKLDEGPVEAPDTRTLTAVGSRWLWWHRTRERIHVFSLEWNLMLSWGLRLS